MPLTTCTNDRVGYRIGYPEQWWANTGATAESCTFFNPEPVELEEATEAPPVAVNLSASPIGFEEARENHRRGSEVLSEESATISGRSVVVFETRSRGEALLPAGTLSYSYVVEFGEGTLIAGTTSRADLDYERNKEVLFHMVASLEKL